MATVTIGSWIEDRSKSTVKMKDYFYKGVLTDDTSRLYVLDDSILIPYDATLNKYKATYELTDDEYRQYRFNPWRVARDIYGSTEYWFLVLHANEMYSANEFDIKRITLYKDTVLRVISEIFTVEDKTIRNNATEVTKFMKGLPSNLNTI